MTRAAIGVLVAVAALFTPGAAWAHNAGRVELLVTNLKFNPLGPGVMVSADLVDRDSGATAAGFAIAVSARGDDGASAGPVTLTDARGIGHYEGVLAAGPGSWTVTAKAEQGTSALPALGSTRTVAVNVDENGAVIQRGRHGGSNAGLWIAVTAAVLVLVAGGVLVMTRKTGAPAAQPMGQRV